MQFSYRIVLAEDEPLLLSMLGQAIKRLEPVAMVQMFENGLEALHKYEQEGADLLIVNHAMPELDGPTLIRLLRARGDMVPIVGISGDWANREEHLAAGATEFVESTALISELPALLARFRPG